MQCPMRALLLCTLALRAFLLGCKGSSGSVTCDVTCSVDAHGAQSCAGVSTAARDAVLARFAISEYHTADVRAVCTRARAVWATHLSAAVSPAGATCAGAGAGAAPDEVITSVTRLSLV